jgi:RNA polymerase sigma-70 factor (ECF subfamily)
MKGLTAVSPDIETLVSAYGARIHAYLWRLLRDPAEADDALQETFLRAFRALARLDGHANPQAWLYRIATNVAHTRQRQRARQAVRTATLDAALAAPGPGPAEQADRQSLLAAVAVAVERLPYRQRAALIMRKFEEIPYADIAAALGCTEAAARANVYQAIRKLKSVIGDW